MPPPPIAPRLYPGCRKEVGGWLYPGCTRVVLAPRLQVGVIFGYSKVFPFWAVEASMGFRWPFSVFSVIFRSWVKKGIRVRVRPKIRGWDEFGPKLGLVLG